jgi:hypothetical protein
MRAFSATIVIRRSVGNKSAIRAVEHDNPLVAQQISNICESG